MRNKYLQNDFDVRIKPAPFNLRSHLDVGVSRIGPND